jgi:hypothetical protein
LERRWALSDRPAAHGLFFLRRRNQAFALGLLACQFAGSADGFTFLSRRLLRRLFVEPSTLHLAKHAFALHFLFEHPKCLVDVVVTDEYLQNRIPSWSVEERSTSGCSEFGKAWPRHRRGKRGFRRNQEGLLNGEKAKFSGSVSHIAIISR